MRYWEEVDTGKILEKEVFLKDNILVSLMNSII